MVISITSVFTHQRRNRGQSRVARSRAVHEAVAAEFGEPQDGGLHALALTTVVPGAE